MTNADDTLLEIIIIKNLYLVFVKKNKKNMQLFAGKEKLEWNLFCFFSL